MTLAPAHPSIHRVIGERIHYYRKALGLTQAALAKKVGVARVTISSFEHAHTHMSIATLVRVACALHVPVCDLIDPLPTGARP